MAMLNFKMGLHENLPASYNAGTVYVTTDEQGMYVDISNSSRIRINQIISYNTFADFTAALDKATPPYSTEAFYYIISENALLKYNLDYGAKYDPDGTGETAAAKGKWVQINSTADVESALAAVSGRVTDLETWKKDIDSWKTSVDTDIASLKAKDTALDEEIANLKAADVTLQTNIDNEAAARKSADETLQANIDAEAKTRAEEDGKLNSAISAVAEDLADEVTRAKGVEATLTTATQNNATAIANEKSRAEAKEAELATAIANEKTRAEAEEERLAGLIADNASDITNLDTDLTNEITRAKAAEEKIATFDANGNVTGGALKAEIDRATSAEDELDKAIDQEIADRKAADEALDKKIEDNTEAIGTNAAAITDLEIDLANEITRATGAEEQLGKDIADEQARAEGVEAELAQAIADEQARAEGVEAKLQKDIDANAEAIKNLNSSSTNLSEALAKEVQDREDADDALSTRITNEVNRATAAEQAIAVIDASGAVTGGALKTEIDRAKSEETRIEGKVDANTTKINTNASNITNLETNLANEITRAEAAEEANASAIATEKARAESEEAKLSAAITAETNRATKVESDLSTRISANTTAIEENDSDILALGEDLAAEAKAREDADKVLQKNIDALDERLTEEIQTADAMVYKGAISAISELPTSNVEVGWTYKVTADILKSTATGVNFHNTDDTYIRIGDILIAKGTETDGVITSDLSWDHIPSGYVADYNPVLAADSHRDGAQITLTKANEDVEMIIVRVAEGNESLKVTGDDNQIIISMEWGSFDS